MDTQAASEKYRVRTLQEVVDVKQRLCPKIQMVRGQLVTGIYEYVRTHLAKAYPNTLTLHGEHIKAAPLRESILRVLNGSPNVHPAIEIIEHLDEAHPVKFAQPEGVPSFGLRWNPRARPIEEDGVPCYIVLRQK
jgi:hypothetical protein